MLSGGAGCMVRGNMQTDLWGLNSAREQRPLSVWMTSSGHQKYQKLNTRHVRVKQKTNVRFYSRLDILSVLKLKITEHVQICM